MTTAFDFWERLHFSSTTYNDIEQVLIKRYKALNVFTAHLSNDKQGIDMWVETNGKCVGVDAKVRQKDFGFGDVALEDYSVIEKDIPGWTVDPNKKTDLILFYWANNKRSWLVDFKKLRAATIDNIEKWRVEYKVAKQQTNTKYGHYTSSCVFVPITVIKSAIKELEGVSDDK